MQKKSGNVARAERIHAHPDALAHHYRQILVVTAFREYQQAQQHLRAAVEAFQGLTSEEVQYLNFAIVADSNRELSQNAAAVIGHLNAWREALSPGFWFQGFYDAAYSVVRQMAYQGEESLGELFQAIPGPDFHKDDGNKPDSVMYEPELENPSQFLARCEEHVRSVTKWYRSRGVIPVGAAPALEVHARWSVWRRVEKLSYRVMDGRENLKGQEIQHTAIRKAVLNFLTVAGVHST